MSLREWFRRLGLGLGADILETPARSDYFPDDVLNAGQWDRYWTHQIESQWGQMEQAFNDMMSSDETLVALLRARSCRTILCAGIGLSSEAAALSLYGFRVTALDVSAVATGSMTQVFARPDHPLRQIPGCRWDERGTISFADDSAIEVTHCAPIHRGESRPQGGGSLAHALGDLRDPEVCPGPYDAIIERRTVQLFPAADRAGALDRLAARLGTPGTLVSHEHCGGWRPDQPRRHFASDWAAARGFAVGARKDLEGVDAAPRLARLVFTTG